MELGKQECMDQISEIKYKLLSCRQSLEGRIQGVGGYYVKAIPELCAKITEAIVLVDDLTIKGGRR